MKINQKDKELIYRYLTEKCIDCGKPLGVRWNRRIGVCLLLKMGMTKEWIINKFMERGI